jgi:transcriptional regulator with XRE-family HTH domain
MEFKDKLPVIRKSRGYSQEALAELVGVSRQAVAKWELGQGYPDVDNLIRLSEALGMSIDRLVKDEDIHYFIAHNRKNPTYHEEMIDFLIHAKRSTYAAKGAECSPTRLDSHDLEYRDGDYFYYDTYLGGDKFCGEEAVWYKNVPIWCMNYIGRLLDDNFSGDFLKEALLLVPKESPYRGPNLYQNGDYLYHCSVTGEFEWYQGKEEIFCKNQKIYECIFHGGMIK